MLTASWTPLLLSNPEIVTNLYLYRETDVDVSVWENTAGKPQLAKTED